MNEEIIKHTIDMLQSVAADKKRAERFDLGFWGNSMAQHQVEKEEPDCGFSGCLIGWAAHERWYEQFGYEITLVSSSDTTNPRCRFEPEFRKNGTPIGKSYNASVAFGSMLEVRGLVAEHIIMPEYYESQHPSVQKVVDRLILLIELGDQDAFLDALS